MNSEDVLNDYRSFYLSLSDDVFKKRSRNFHAVLLRLQVVKEKLALFVESRFEAYKFLCHTNHIGISFGLKDAVNHESRSSELVIDLIESTDLKDWNQSFWAYARFYAKVSGYSVVTDPQPADLLTYLQILTSCRLFPEYLRKQAIEVIRIRNEFYHSPTFQINSLKLRLVFKLINNFEIELIH